jgi:hypothetical protein
MATGPSRPCVAAIVAAAIRLTKVISSAYVIEAAASWIARRDAKRRAIASKRSMIEPSQAEAMD